MVLLLVSSTEKEKTEVKGKGLSRKLNKIWNILLPLKEGQRVRVVRVIPSLKTMLISQGGWGLDFRGEIGKIILINNGGEKDSPCCLVVLEKQRYKLPNSSLSRDRLWFASEELEAIE